GGGFGTVYKAYDSVEQTYVALKFFNRTDLLKYNLKAEIARAKKLSHDNLCKYFSLEEKSISNIHGEEESLEIAILEYIPGGAIDKYLQKHPKHRDRILKDVLRGLLYLHSKGIIHRDISPSNILVDDSGAQPVAKIIDFGISKEINGEHSVSSHLIGKPQYMAPEQYRPKVYGENEKIDTRVDLWSFGMVAYELLSGKRIAQQLNLNTESSGWIEDLNQADIDVCLETIAEPWRSVLQRCLVKHAAQRAKTADELLDLLNEKKSAPQEQGTQKTIVNEKKSEIPSKPKIEMNTPAKKGIGYYAKIIGYIQLVGLGITLLVGGMSWIYIAISSDDESDKFINSPSVVNEKKYKTVTIGKQVWMAENLNVDKYKNGEQIPEARSNEKWQNYGMNGKAAWCYQDNDSSNGTKYGKLYNWYAVTNPNGLCPAGWHVPSDKEWAELINNLGGEKNAAKQLKGSIGLKDAENARSGPDDQSTSFNGLPTGGRDIDGSFYDFSETNWWSSTEKNQTYAWFRNLQEDASDIARYALEKKKGFSVRCIKDSVASKTRAIPGK
ncbi:MAG: FISUMP domain-containing protein, partial [Bacteroidia bacterium]